MNMVNDLSARILSSLRSDCHIQPETPVVAGVSGGIDSVFLLAWLHKLGQPLIAAVFNHGLRPEAPEECDFVKAFCSERGIPCILGSGDVRSYAEAGHTGIEAAARELRYRFLFDTAEKKQAAAVITAHHANDRAETVLLHLLRGTGIDGLSGMRPYALPNPFSETIPLTRPLLGVTRAEIEAYMSENGIPYREDSSNSGPEFTRNRIRLDLIPKLEREYNPKIVESLCRLAETASADADILNEITGSTAKYIGALFPDDRVEWSRKAYQAQPDGLRMRLLRLFFSKLVGETTDISYKILKQADDFFLNARYNRIMPVFGKVSLQCEGNKASIINSTNNVQWKYPQLSQGWTLSAETQHISENELPYWIRTAKEHPEWGILDANQVADYPVLRKIRLGERFSPYGMGGRTQKLSDFLINNRIPEPYRADLAVAADEGGIVWIPGLRVSNRCALHPGTHRIMILKLEISTER